MNFPVGSAAVTRAMATLSGIGSFSALQEVGAATGGGGGAAEALALAVALALGDGAAEADEDGEAFAPSAGLLVLPEFAASATGTAATASRVRLSAPPVSTTRRIRRRRRPSCIARPMSIDGG